MYSTTIDPMNQNKLKSFVASLACVAGAAWLASFLMFSWLEPEGKATYEQWQQLEKATGNDSIEDLKNTCLAVQLSTQDKDIAQFANLLHRTMEFYLNCGNTRLSEIGSLTGYVNIGITGFTNPLKSLVVGGLQGIPLVIELESDRTEALLKRIETKISRYEKDMTRAAKWKNITFWGVLISGGFIFVLPTLADASTVKPEEAPVTSR